MAKKIVPAYIAGKVHFDFFANEDEQYRDKNLNQICKLACKELNISGINISPREFEPDIGILAFSAIASDTTKARNLANKILDFLEINSSARIVSDDWIVEELI